MKILALSFAVSFLAAWSGGAVAGDFASHPPQRPLPVASQRALSAGDIRVVDAARGDDAGVGTAERPWRTLEHAVGQLQKGGVICLRGGVHRMHAAVERDGERGASAGDSLVAGGTGGARWGLCGICGEFPATAWEPCADGVAGEFSSTKTYPLTEHGRVTEADGDGEVLAMGRFVDSMVPLHGSRFRWGLQSDNPWGGR